MLLKVFKSQKLYYEFWINLSVGRQLHSGDLLGWQIWLGLVCHLGKMLELSLISYWQKVVIRLRKWMLSPQICLHPPLTLLWCTTWAWLTHYYQYFCCLCFSSLTVALSDKEVLRWSEKVINRRRLGASPSRRLVRQSKVSVTEFSSFLKQDHKWKWDSTWSSPVRRRSGWRVPLAMDRAQWKKSKPIQTFFQYVHSPTVYMWLSL